MHRFLVLFALCLQLSHRAVAQDACAEMLMVGKDDVELEYTVFDKKGKESAKVKTKVILVEETKEGTVFHFESQTTPETGTRDNIVNTYYMRCFKDTLFMSMKCMLPSGTLENYSSMDLTMETKDLPLPKAMKEDEELPEGNLNVVVSSNGMKVLSLKANTNKRKVEKKEAITVPAGTFDCVKVSQTTEVKIGFITNRTNTSTWYAPGTGMVKQETYDKKGKLESRIELQKKEE